LKRGPDDPAARDAVLKSLNALLDDKDLALAELPPDLPLPQHVRILRGRDPAKLSGADVRKLNRGLLEIWHGRALRRRRPSVLEDVPPRMLADISGDREGEPGKFVSGIAEGDERISFADVPWHVWRRPLLFWAPLILAMCVAVTALALLVHRQWSSHEHLPYPTIEFVRALLPEEGCVWSGIFRDRLFWLGAVAVMVLYLNNYACGWWPAIFVRVRMTFDFMPLMEIVPALKRGDWWPLFSPTIMFIPLGFAYFLAADVSLSLGIAGYVYCLAGGILVGYGIPISGGLDRPSMQAFLHAGAYVGMFLCLVYSGRHYYLTALRRSVFLPARGEVEPHVVWAGRVFLAATAFFILQLVAVGVDWQMAALYTAGAFVIFVVISRLVAEAGVFFVHAFFFPCALLWGFLGAGAAGPDQLLLLGMVSALLVSDPREAMMPFVVSALRLADRGRVRLGGVAQWGTVALVIGFAVAVPVTLYLQYQHGGLKTGDGWTIYGVPTFGFQSHVQIRSKLEGQGRMRAAEGVSGWQRFAEASPERKPMICFAVTFGAVLLFAFLRHRFAWWPLHPALFLVLGTYQSKTLAFSFLLGWVVKVLVVKYGGSRLYNRLKALIIGLIAGEMLGAIIPMIIGAIYYLVTGEPPQKFRILPT